MFFDHGEGEDEDDDETTQPLTQPKVTSKCRFVDEKMHDSQFKMFYKMSLYFLPPKFLFIALAKTKGLPLSLHVQ